MDRAERFRLRDLAIARAFAVARAHGFPGPEQAHRWAKHRVLARCSSPHCSICTLDRAEQRRTRRRERHQARRDIDERLAA